MRIGFVSIIRESWGGSEELWSEAAMELLASRHEVYISALNTGTIAPKVQRLIHQGAKLVFRPGFIKPGLSFKERAPKKVINFIYHRIRNPYKEFFATCPDVIIYTGACDSLKDDPYFVKLLHKTQIPLIIVNQVNYEYVRTFDDHDANTLRKVFQYAKKNLFVSRRNKEVMERFLASEIPNATVVRNPVNLDSVEAVPFPASEKVEMAMVANLLINHKGHDIVLDVLRNDVWKRRDWHLNIYGSGIDEVYLKKLVRFFALTDKVTFHGRVNDMKEVWRKNHLLLMPSRLEGTPLAMVEAMLCARPVIATDVGGHAEWIIEGKNGFIAEGANVLSFGRALERAWQIKNDWQNLGADARLQALSLYDPAPGKTLADIICHS